MNNTINNIYGTLFFHKSKDGKRNTCTVVPITIQLIPDIQLHISGIKTLADHNVFVDIIFVS